MVPSEMVIIKDRLSSASLWFSDMVARKTMPINSNINIINRHSDLELLLNFLFLPKSINLYVKS